MSDDSLFDAEGNPRLQPTDGYRIKSGTLPSHETVLWIELRVKGDLVHTTELYNYDTSSPEELGLCSRTRLILEALCRFLDTGGSLQGNEPGSLPEILRRLTAADIHGLELPEDFIVVDSFYNTDGHWEHLFLNPERQALRWVEDSFVDAVTWEDVGQALEEAAANEQSIAGDHPLSRRENLASPGAIESPDPDTPAESAFDGQ